MTRASTRRVVLALRLFVTYSGPNVPCPRIMYCTIVIILYMDVIEIQSRDAIAEGSLLLRSSRPTLPTPEQSVLSRGIPRR